MDQVFSSHVKKENIKKYWENGGKNLEVREFCQSGKLGTMLLSCYFLINKQNLLLEPVLTTDVFCIL